MVIKIIKRISAVTGKTSLQLEYYMGYYKDENGKIKHKRKYETLKYFLYSKPKTIIEKEHNRINLEMAEAVKARRILAFQNNYYNFYINSDDDTRLLDYIGKLTENRKESRGNYGNWYGMMTHLRGYCNRYQDIMLGSVDREFVIGFKNYLEKSAKMQSGANLAPGSQKSYFVKFKAALNQAVEDGSIAHSPASDVKPVQVQDIHREYLTLEELQALVKTDCRIPILKRAFLFSCLTGLRWSDINKLIWREIQEFDGMMRVVFRQKKTKGFEYLDISNQAVKYLGKRGKPDAPVFADLRYSAWNNIVLRRWSADAGINKRVTFHCGRHTFAVMQLALGTEIYTVSKLLGHKELKTTQIYAQIIDKKKREAVNRIPEIG